MKKILSCFITIMMLVVMNAGMVFAEENNYKPDLSIEDRKIPEVKVGGTLELDLNLKNKSSYTAKEITVTPVLTEEMPFVLENITSYQTFDILKPKGKVNFKFKFRIKTGIDTKIYPITLKYNYRNLHNDNFEKEEIIYVKVISGYTSPKLEISNIKTNPEDIQAGDDAKLSFDVTNSGMLFAKEIKISLEGLDGSSFTLSSDSNTRKIELLMGNSAKETVSFNLHANSGMEEGNYPVNIKLEYLDRDNNKITEEQNIFLRVNSDVDSDLSIENISFPQEKLIPGEDFNISLDIKNIGSGTAEDLIVSMDGGEEIIPKSQNTIMVNEIKSNEFKTLNFKLQPIEEAKAKNHLLRINVKKGNKEITNQYFGVEVGRGTNIRLNNITSPAAAIKPDEIFTVSLNVENLGIGTARNVAISVDGGEEIICRSQSVQILNTLDSNEKRTLSFELQAANSAEAKNYPIAFNVTYDGQEGGPIKQHTGVYVDEDGNSKSKPQIIVSGCNTDPNIVNAGENFQLKLKFLNTHRNKDVQNIKIWLTAEEKVAGDEEKSGTVFIPVNGSNTFYIDEIQPKQEVEKNITLYTIPHAKAKVYDVKVNFEYEDNKGEQIKAEDVIGIAVVQPSSFMASDIKLPPQGFVGQPIPISLEVNNTGKVTLDNFMVTVEGDLEASSSKTYIGNITPGSTEYYDVELIPTKTGESVGSIIFSYDEPNGNRKEVKKEIKLNAEEMQMPDPSMQEMQNMNETKKSGNGSKIVIILGIVIAALVVGIVVIKKRKKKKGMDLDE